MGLAVLVVTGLVAVALWFAVSADPIRANGVHSGFLFGLWHVLYANQMPSPVVIAAAVSSALFLMALVVFVDHRITTRFRLSTTSRTTPLAPKVVMAETRGVFAGEVSVTVLIPAHNEAALLPETIASLWRQSRLPLRLIVIADACTDATEEVARAHGAEVMVSVDNRHQKAGALNQAFSRLLPELGDNDVVLVMDADTVLKQGFLEHAVARFREDRALMAVGGQFYGEPGHGLIGAFQRNEYVRYGREVNRRQGKVFVLAGTATVFRPRALRAVASARGDALPGRRGDVYDVASLIEDNELTIALRTLGALMISPRQCQVVTELMPTWRDLWNQRLRWQRGALENLGTSGVTPATSRYWVQQLGIGYGVFALVSYVVLLALLVLAVDHWVWLPFWLLLGGIFVVERVVTAWRAGWAGRALAVLVLPELGYRIFIQMVFVKGVLDMSFARSPSGKHMSTSGAAKGVLT